MALLGALVTTLEACAEVDLVTDSETASALATGQPSMMWMPVGSMQESRRRHAAVKLTNQKVLVAGGSPDSEIVRSSAEIFDLGTYSFSSAGSMAEARLDHTMTMLDGGQVLVAGGWNNDSDDQYRATAEVFDPVTTSWSAVGSMAVARAHHTAVKLVDGRVLVAGGRGQFTTFTIAEIFDPDTATFSIASSMTVSRNRHRAVRLLNGKVLVIGGYGIFGAKLASTELYDPATNSFSAAAPMHVARADFQAVVLVDGTVLVAGSTDDAEIYNPSSNTWSIVGSMSWDRGDFTLTALPDGRVLAAGGVDHHPPYASSPSSVEIFDPSVSVSAPVPVSSGTWTEGPAMGMARYGHTATMIDHDKLLVTGGGGWTTSATAELFSLTGAFSM